VLMALASASRLRLYIVGVSPNYWASNGYIVFLFGTIAIFLIVFLTVWLRKHWTERAQHRPWRIFRWELRQLM
jgi:hypothetical protein